MLIGFILTVSDTTQWLNYGMTLYAQRVLHYISEFIKMKKRIIIVTIIIGIFFCGTAFSQEIEPSDPIYKSLFNKTLTPFFKALKEGDIDAIKHYISGDFYEKSKILLEQNKDYPRFLRSQYKNATFYVQRVEKINDEVLVEIEIRFGNSVRSYKKLLFKLDPRASTSNWKAVRQIKR